MQITSLQNPRIKQLIALRERREREQSGLMRVEGYDEINLALQSNLPLTTLFYSPEDFADAKQGRLLEEFRQRRIEMIEVTQPVFAKIAYRENPDGWLATAPALRRTLNDLYVSVNPFVVIAVGVEKPGNLGAILRTADAAGVDAVIACDPLTDWGNPNVIRASKGAVFSVPVAEANTNDMMNWLLKHQIRIVAATPDAKQLYTQADFTEAIAIVVGEEKHGLSQQWIQQADEAVKIPMQGRVNSLNVATAAALLIYEVVRQRS